MSMAVTLGKVFGPILVRAIRYGWGEIYKTNQRKHQERKALAWAVFDSKGKPDEWPFAENDDRNEVSENTRERYLRTFGRDGQDGLDTTVDRFEKYLAGQGAIFIAQDWDDAPD